MATLIPADGSAPRFVEPAGGRSMFTLAELQALVGGYIELVRVPFRVAAGTLVLFCNEDGKRLQLPVNRYATALMRVALQPNDVLVGDVVLCTPTEAGEGVDSDDDEDVTL